MRALRRMLRRSRATVLLEAAGALVTVAVLLMGPAGGPTGTARIDLSRAAGTLSLANSREGTAIFQAANMRPAEQASGSVRVTNTGTLPATLTLAPTVNAGAGTASQLLAARLQLAVSDVTVAGRPVAVYAGPLAAMPAVSLGALRAGSARDFLFVSWLPVAADNALQGATLAAAFSWTAVAASPAVPPTPAPTVTPAPTPPPAGGPGTTCKTRKVRIRIRRWHGHRARRVMVKVGHRHAYRAKVRHGRIKVKVRGRVKIKVTIKYAGGHRKVIRRRVRGC
jgi:spore coat-associated protein N